jgi:protein ImuB
MPARQSTLDIDCHPEVQAQRALGDGPASSAPSFAGHLRWPPQDGDDVERCAALIDALRQRLGPHSVRRFEAVASHIPERAEILSLVDGEALQSPPPGRRRSTADSRRAGGSCTNDEAKTGHGEAWEQTRRPLLLLPRAEPTEVTALVPDGPPRRFCWRGVTYEVAGAQGPERIASEWWLLRTLNPSAHSRDGEDPILNGAKAERQQALTRDYYLVEDADGHRFWLYREGLYGRETTAARWFVHGLFA